MKVEWSKRATLEHQRIRKVDRVKARLQGHHIGDVTLAVPALTSDQWRDLAALHRRLKELTVLLENQLASLDLAINCLRPDHHEDGWADVHVIGQDTSGMLVADIRHQSPKAPGVRRQSGHSVVTRNMNTWLQPKASQRRRRR